jgi:hypothetical protein
MNFGDIKGRTPYPHYVKFLGLCVILRLFWLELDCRFCVCTTWS